MKYDSQLTSIIVVGVYTFSVGVYVHTSSIHDLYIQDLYITFYCYTYSAAYGLRHTYYIPKIVYSFSFIFFFNELLYNIHSERQLQIILNRTRSSLTN